MNRPTCDNDCTRMGWKEYFLSSLYGHEIHASVPPDTDLDDSFIAFSHDEQELIRVNGWLFAAVEVEGAEW